MLLQKYIQIDHVFTLEIVNERILKFSYGVVDMKNRPSPLKPQVLTSNSGTISQTGNPCTSCFNFAILDYHRCLTE